MQKEPTLPVSRLRARIGFHVDSAHSIFVVVPINETLPTSTPTARRRTRRVSPRHLYNGGEPMDDICRSSRRRPRQKSQRRSPGPHRRTTPSFPASAHAYLGEQRGDNFCGHLKNFLFILYPLR